jgi:hypothetical protein
MEIQTERRAVSTSPLHGHHGCWYCGSRLHEGKRFCNSNCAQAFEEDDLAPQRHIDAKAGELSLAEY